MLDHGYWENLKKFYENDYHGIMPRAMDIDFVNEMKRGGATLLDDESRFDPNRIDAWTEATIREAYQEAEDGSFMNIYGEYEEKSVEDTEMIKLFPHLFEYGGSIEEIASFFMWEDIDKFKERINLGDEDYVNEAIRLKWDMMLAEIPAVKDIFMF